MNNRLSLEELYRLIGVAEKKGQLLYADEEISQGHSLRKAGAE
jgi:hypothetical protein